MLQAPLTLSLTLEQGRPLTVEVGDLRHRLRSRDTWTCRWSVPERCWKEGDYVYPH
jgi:hypothetical protein